MYPVAVAKVAATLGGARTLGTSPNTVGELAEAVAHGLPRGVVPELAAAAAPKRGALRQRIAALSSRRRPTSEPSAYRLPQASAPSASPASLP